MNRCELSANGGGADSISTGHHDRGSGLRPPGEGAGNDKTDARSEESVTLKSRFSDTAARGR